MRHRAVASPGKVRRQKPSSWRKLTVQCYDLSGKKDENGRLKKLVAELTLDVPIPATSRARYTSPMPPPPDDLVRAEFAASRECHGNLAWR